MKIEINNVVTSSFSTNNDILEGLTFDQLIKAVIEDGEKKIDDNTVMKVFGELLKQRTNYAKVEVKQEMPSILEMIQNSTETEQTGII